MTRPALDTQAASFGCTSRPLAHNSVPLDHSVVSWECAYVYVLMCLVNTHTDGGFAGPCPSAKTKERLLGQIKERQSTTPATCGVGTVTYSSQPDHVQSACLRVSHVCVADPTMLLPQLTNQGVPQPLATYPTHTLTLNQARQITTDEGIKSLVADHNLLITTCL